MITEWLMSFGSGFADWLLTIMPGVPIIDGFIGSAAALGGFAGSLGVWVNWVGIGLLVGQVMAVYLAMFIFKIIRAIIGHLPIIGGNG